MKLDVNHLYRLKHPVKLSAGLYGGVIVPKQSLLKVLYWDNAIADCEVLGGAMDGFHFATTPEALVLVSTFH